MKSLHQSNRNAESDAPAQVGPAACSRLLSALVGHVLSSGHGNWFVRLRRAGADATQAAKDVRSVDQLRLALSHLRGSSERGCSVDAQVHLHEPGAFMTPGCDSLYAATSLCVGI